MPKKKSVQLAAESFQDEVDDIREFLEQAKRAKFDDDLEGWVYDYGIIRLHSAFETLVLEGLVGVINNDSSTLSETTGIGFPPHLTKSVCEYLVVGGGYFDFRGRDGLIRLLRQYVPADSYLLTTVSDAKYRTALVRMTTLRNFAAHRSKRAKAAAIKACSCNMSSAGAWLRRQGRLEAIMGSLHGLAQELHDNAPY